MKVSLNWLKELVDYTITSEQLASKLSLNSIGVKQQAEDYLELDLTYNRGDLLSLRGVAYEVGAITDRPLKFLSQPVQDFTWVGKKIPEASVSVENNDLSAVYCIAKIENLRVEQSNNSWVKKLADSGIRTINNIADITNLIMVEYGQPMHAFDASKVKDETLIVRTAKKGEKLTTLDGKVRNLDQTDLLITDPEKSLGLAGIMGGKDSEITNSTTTILLEAAIFNPVSIRNTSKRHGLYSEASKRFQHGLSPTRLLQALDAAIRLYQDLGGELTAINLMGDFNQPKKTIILNIKKTNNLLGLILDEKTIISCLKRLNFAIRKVGLDTLEVTPPYFRLDINIEEDLMEEVARMYGYEKIEGLKLTSENIPKLDQTLPNFIYKLKLRLREIGLTEVQTYSFYSSAVLQSLKSPKSDINDYLKVANPISSETEYLRMDLWPNLLEVVGKNIKKGYKDIAIFEIGKIHFRDGEGHPAEKYTLSMTVMNDSDNPLEELVSLFQNLSTTLDEVNISQAKDASTLFHPKRILDIKRDSQRIGGAGEIHLRTLNKLGIEKRVAVLEINLEKLI